MVDDSGTHKLRLSDLKKSSEPGSSGGFSKDEIDSLAELIGENDTPSPKIDLDDTGRFKR
jgi:hypothetical protein